MESHGITTVIIFNSVTVYPEGDMNLCDKPSNCCQDVSLKDTNVDLVVTQGEKVSGVYPLGTIDIFKKNMTIHPIVDGIFHPGPTWWTKLLSKVIALTLWGP